MKLQRNIPLEWGFSHPKILFSIVCALLLIEIGFLIPIQYEERAVTYEISIKKPVPKMISVKESIHVQELKIEKEPIQEKKNREEMIKMINETYGSDYDEIVSKQKDIHLLAQLIYAEAGNQDRDGKQFVADVVMNRLRSEKFPNSIEEIIYQEGQFGVITDGAFEEAKEKVTMNEVKIAKDAIEKGPKNCLILYFNTEKIKGVEHWFKYEDHWFGW